MEDGDDDFGDLYADIDVEAINVAQQISQIRDEHCRQDGDTDNTRIGVDSEDDDDDDDDLDIVLNRDDDNREGFTIARSTTDSRSREMENEDDDNSLTMFQYLRSQPAAYGSDLQGIGCMTAGYMSREDSGYWQQMGPQSTQRFSLPRARNILDVNIDIFEQKPWKRPGADITDYFNFGFNEDSWKHYCNQVDEYRHRGPLSNGTPPSESTQSTEVERRKGQAIQVEDSLYERQSSMDVRRQVDRDSDVIQITILDQEDTYVPEEFNHGDVSGDDVIDHLIFSSASEDESVEVNHVETDIYNTPKVSSSSDYHEIHQVLTNDTIRTLEDAKESNLVAESSQEEKSSANRFKSIEDDAFIDRRKVYTHDRRLTELTQSVKPDYHNLEDWNKSDDKRGPDEKRYHARRFGDCRNHGDRIYHERCNNPVYKNKTLKDFNLRIHHENDYIISRRTDVKRKFVERRYHARHNDGFFPMSDDVHSSFCQSLHAFDPYNEENISYSKLEASSDYYGERFIGYEDCDTEKFGAIYRSLEEGGYYDENRRYIEDNRMMTVDWRHREKGQKKGDNLYFRNKGETDEFYLEPGYYDDTDEENFKSFSYNDRKRENVDYIKWEFRSPGRKKRRVCNLFSEVNDPFLKRENEQSFASHFPEESHINNHKCHGNMKPKKRFYRRHGSSGGQYFEPFDRKDYIIDIDNHVDMRRKRCNWQSEIQWEDGIMFRHEDAKFCAHKNSFPFERVSKRKGCISELGPDHIEESIDDLYLVDSHMVDRYNYDKELTDGQYANGCKYYKQKYEIFSGNKCIAHGKSHERLPLSSRKSHFVVGQVKFPEKHKKPELVVLDSCKNDKMARIDDPKAIDEGLDIEEGQIVTEELKVGPMIDKTSAHGNEPFNQEGKSGFDSTRILDAMAKMEKRRARFNEPIIITKKGSDKSANVTAADSNKKERPARKRRWGGS
ncbi:hypothetical protein R6Q59_010747 [Mikania micrantha]